MSQINKEFIIEVKSNQSLNSDLIEWAYPVLAEIINGDREDYLFRLEQGFA